MPKLPPVCVLVTPRWLMQLVADTMCAMSHLSYADGKPLHCGKVTGQAGFRHR